MRRLLLLATALLVAWFGWPQGFVVVAAPTEVSSLTSYTYDGQRTFRPPSWKPDLGKYQANFEYWLEERVGKPFGNGHLDITDMGP